MISFIISVLSLFSIGQSTYLRNEEPNIQYLDIKTGGAISVNHQYPYVGFGCSVNYNDQLILVTSSNYPTWWIRQSEGYKCTKTQKKVEVMRYNITNNEYIDSIITTGTSDYILSCGIDKKLKTLYYIAGNYYNCPSNYNLDSSITRIDLNDFTFIDKTLLKNIDNIPSFYSYSSSSYWSFRYIHSPTTSLNIDGNSLWLGFGGHYTGIWRLNISTTPIKLIDSIQREYYEIMDEGMGMPGYEDQEMLFRFQHIKKSFYLNNSIYFVDDSGYRDAKLLKINTSNFLNNDNFTMNENNTEIITLDGINYISDIEVDEFRKRIYFVTGILNSEMYMFDYNFNKISLSVDCNIDFLKFPTEWGVITNIILDEKTKYLYALPSTRHPFAGIVKINTKELTIDSDKFEKFGYYKNYTYTDYRTGEDSVRSYFNYLNHMNITSNIDENGNLYIFPTSNWNRKQFIVMNLFGCSTGFGIQNSSIETCELCKPGKYSDEVGNICKNCNPGFSSDEYESIHCEKCEAGKYTTDSYNIECLECDAGKYSEIEGSSLCLHCNEGKYSIVIGSDSKDNCIECEDGKISENGATECQFCEIGKWAKLRKECISCSLGKYSISLGLIDDNQCILCPIGKYSNVFGIANELDCIECENGKIGIIEGASSNNSCVFCELGKFKKSLTTCDICPDGWISNILENRCDNCEIGRWAWDKKSCIDCDQGRYSFSTGLISSKECIACEKGKYQPEMGEITENSCIECSNGKIGIIIAAKSNSSCVFCEIGKYKNSLTSCTICPDGWISNILENKCDLCEIGKWALDKKNCIDCDEGSYSFSTGLISSEECISCEKGKFQPEKGEITENSCIECSKGRIGVIMAAKSNDSCIFCEVGKYKNSLTSCTICPDGWISNILENKCDLCEVGKWALDKKQCVDCDKGRYSFSTGLISGEECISCEKGKFQPERGEISENSCIECDDGKIGIIDGAISDDSCISCQAGKFKKISTRCQTCPIGWISIKESMECFICPEGKITDSRGLECLNCSKGKYNDIIGLSMKTDNCKDCPSGKYSETKGNLNIFYCKDCPIGKYNTESGLIGEIFCISCKSGKYRNSLQNPGQSCVLCINGKFSLDSAYECITCLSGKYSTNKFNECINCPAGRYNLLDGQHTKNTCLLCPSGKWNEIFGSNSLDHCIECNAGLYSNIEGAISIATCKECPEGRYNDINGADSMNDCKECSTGSFSLSGSINCLLCEKGKYNSIMGSSECKLCEEGKFTSSKGSFICDNCPINSEQNYNKDGCICSASSYNTNNKNETISCSGCTDEFICGKGTTIQTLNLKKNFWRENKDTINTYKCKNIYACKGGIITNHSDNLCQEGHKGPLCDVCEKGWAKDDGVCLKCPENESRTIGLTILIPLICILLIIFLVKTANPSNNKKEEINGVVKIFMNYAQVFSLASSFQINWPGLIRYLFERAKEFSSPRVSFYSSDCAIGWSYYDKLIVYLALPLFYMLSVTMVIAIISLCYCSKKKKKVKKINSPTSRANYLKNKPTCLEFFSAWEKTAIVVGTFLSWPTIVEKTLEVMNCEKIGSNYYLVKDVSVSCYDSKHYQYLMVSYIAIIFYGIGIPLLGFYLLFKYRYRLYDMQNRYDGSTPLSFLFLGYREKRWYYEFIIMGKKAGLILLSVFLKNYPRYQIIGASLLVQISFFLHVFLRPYDTITSYGMICNKLESISLLSLVMTLSTGLFFGTIDSGYQLGLFEDILIILLLLCNGSIVLYFFIYFMVLAKKTFISNLRDKSRDYFDKNKEPWFICCCKDENKMKFKEWVYLRETNNYGIHLKNDLEKQIFSNYFKEKKSKLNVLNNKIDRISKRRLSIKLDKIRSEIQVMEKQRCWQTIQNNRLYGKLKKVAMVNKIGVGSNEIGELNDVFKLYIKHGVKYNDQMNDLYMGELKDMIPDSPISVPDSPININKNGDVEIEMTNQITLSKEQLSKLSIKDENIIII